MKTHKSRSWQLRRSELNHNWLKNVYLGYFARVQGILDGALEDPEGLTLFLNELPRWEHRRDEFKRLASGYETAMSPRGLLEIAPLSNLPIPERRWLGEVIHVLWMSKYHVVADVNLVKERLQGVDQAYDAAQECLLGLPPTPRVKDIARCRGELAALRSACLQLTEAVHRLQSEVRVV